MSTLYILVAMASLLPLQSSWHKDSYP